MFSRPIRRLGVGINYREEIGSDIIDNIGDIDFIEVNAERFFVDQYSEHLSKIIRKLPVVLHGLTLSIGADEPISEQYIDNLSLALSTVDCEWFSEHISMTSINGLEVRSLMPVSFNKETVLMIASKAKKIASITNKAFLLENVAYYYSMPNTEYTEAVFISEIIKNTDCGLLLDLNNLYVNSINHRYDPYDFLKHIPIDRIVEVHLAGCDYRYGLLVDTHASKIKRDVLELFEFLCSIADINAVVIERDSNLGSFSESIDEINIVKSIYKKSKNRK